MNDEYSLFEFQSLVGSAQRNELEEIERQRAEERAKAEELRKASMPSSLSASELIREKTPEERQAELDAFLLQERQEVEAVVEKERQEDNEREHNAFPPPTISRK